MRNQNVLRNTLLLTLSGVIAKTVDFTFRAYYTSRLGAEGMGIFSLILSLHSIMLNISSGGMGVAVSKLVSENYATLNGGKAKKTVSIALASVSAGSLVVIGVVYFFAEELAAQFLNEPRCRNGLVLLSPSILFMGVSYCIKGYFYASRKVLRPASSEFLEQFVKISCITFLLKKWLPHGIEQGCSAVALGMTLGEAASCTYLSVLYAFDSRSLNGRVESGLKLVKAIAGTALPVMIAALASSYLRMKEEVLIVSGLEQWGLSHSSALSSYGTVYGMAMPLTVFPLTLLSSFLTLLVPEISRAKKMRGSLRLETLTARIYRFALVSGFFIMCVYLMFAGELSMLVYSAPQLASTLRCLALLSPMMLIDSISCGILNGLGRQNAILCFSISDSVLRLALISVLIPNLGRNGILWVVWASNIFTCALTVRGAMRGSGIRVRPLRFLMSCVSALVCIFVVHNIFNMTVEVITKETVALGILFAAAVYFATATLSGALPRDDAKWLIGRLKSSG